MFLRANAPIKEDVESVNETLNSPLNLLTYIGKIRGKTYFNPSLKMNANCTSVIYAIFNILTGAKGQLAQFLLQSITVSIQSNLIMNFDL